MPLAETTWINGQAGNQIAIADRGLQYGDGFFTTVLLQEGALCNWQAHLARLTVAAQKLGFPPLDQRKLLGDLQQFLAQQTLQGCQTLKILITRGAGGRGYQAPNTPHETLVFQLLSAPKPEPLPENLHEKVEFLPQNHQAWLFLAKEVGVCQTLWGQNAQLAGLKHLNRLENVLARSELTHKSWDDALMLNAQQSVISATQANLCWLQSGEWFTPDLSESGVAGTTLASLRHLLNIQTRQVTLAELKQAESVFFCNALRGVQPVWRLQEHHFNVLPALSVAHTWQQWQAVHRLPYQALMQAEQ